MNCTTAAPVPVPSGRTAAWYALASTAAAPHAGTEAADVADAGEAGAPEAVGVAPPAGREVAVPGLVGEEAVEEDDAVVGAWEVFSAAGSPPPDWHADNDSAAAITAVADAVTRTVFRYCMGSPRFPKYTGRPASGPVHTVGDRAAGPGVPLWITCDTAVTETGLDRHGRPAGAGVRARRRGG
ncbi:hypothetical protein Scel_23460 [Streptomyces cellostaticus]|nr:hypothetical protein Scel_23460 [Streptomyces cellostaticus]